MDFASLGISIDTTGLAKGIADLEKLPQAAARAESGAQQVERAFDKTATAATGAAKAVRDVTAATSASGAAAQGVSATAAAIGSVAQQANAAQSASAALNTNLGRTNAAARQGAQGVKQLGDQQKLTAYQSLQLSNQLQDFFVQVQAGGSPLTAFIQQGSQIAAVFGGFRGALAGLATVFTPAVLGIGALVAGAGALAAAFLVGRNQSQELQKSLALTGNAAGITEGQFNSLAETISRSTGTTVGSTRAALQALVEGGNLTGNTLAQAAQAAQGLSRVTGQSAETIAASFSKGAANVTQFATELQRQFNLLTAEQLKYVKQLDDTGRSQEALGILFKALDGRIAVATTNLGTLERGWQGVKNAASAAINAMLQIGRAPTPEDSIADVQARIAALDSRRSTNPTVTNARRQALQDELANLQAQARENQKLARTDAQRVETERNKTAFIALQDELLSKQERKTKEIAKATELAKRSGATPQELAKVLAGINEKYEDKSGASTARRDAAAEAREAVEAIKQSGQAELQALQGREKVLEAQRAANLVQDRRYYAERVRLANEEADQQIATLKRANEALAGQRLTGADATNRDREIAKNKAEIDKIDKARTTTVQVLGIQETATYKRTQTAIDEARAAAQSYLDTIQRGYDAEQAGAGAGDKERARLAGLLQIREKYEQQRQNLASQRRADQITQERYDSELAIVNEFETKATESYRRNYDTLQVLSRNAATGASRAVANYFDQAADVATQTEELYTNTFKSLEDAIVGFVRTGKVDFKSLADSVITEIVRIQVKAAATSLFGGGGGGSPLGLIGSIISLFGGGSSGLASIASGLPGDSLDNFINLGGARETGGIVSRGGIYPVAEHGRPELLNVGGKSYLMMGNNSGDVVPMRAASGSSGGAGGVPGVSVINNGPPVRVDSAEQMDDGTIALIIDQAVDRTIASIEDPSGRGSKAIGRGFNVQRKRL